MAKYDGLIIPRSYSDYLNKADGATLSQMLDSIGGTFDASPTPNSVKPARSGGIFAANAVITSDNATLSGVTISERSVVRVMFTADLTGSDETTGLTLTYNGNTYAVKVGKDGALEALTAHLIEESYIYLQAYTTLELAFDGSQFVVMGNPVVISNADLSIMADGSITYTKTKIDNNYTRKIASSETFGSSFYPSTYKITVASNACIHITAYVANELNSVIGSIDLYVTNGNAQLVSSTNYEYSVVNNDIFLSALNGSGYTKIYEIEIINGNIVSMNYV